jgi:hypothetical protein
MATYQAPRTVSSPAGSAVTIYRFVRLDTDGQYDHVGTAQARIDGICAESVGTVGKTFPMVVPDGCIAKVEAGGSFSVGADIASDSSGRVIAAVSGVGNFTAGIARTASTGSGQIVEIQFLVDRDQA